MDIKDFRRHAHELADWMADYLEDVSALQVKPKVEPGSVARSIADSPPNEGEAFEAIMEDFRQKIMPSIVHWQHPGFMAYFPANSSPPSILAEMLTATLGNQCMVWDTSPAATELEERMMEWLKVLLDLPQNYLGVIQDTASTATLAALLCARERASNWTINEHGFKEPTYRIYASAETHSSIEKGVKIAGFGRQNLVKIDVDEGFRLDPVLLEAQIEADIKAGFIPTCVIATLGTTGVTAIDPVDEMAQVCEKHKVWLHVDAAYAGTALALPEYRWMAKGLDRADSFVFNPHKWMFTNFDCTAYYIRDKHALLKTFAILPEYLKYEVSHEVHDYRDWGIPLGRRFRALKLWFVLRSYGVTGIREKLRLHIRLSSQFESYVDQHPALVLAAPRTLNLVCFYLDNQDEKIREDQNKALLAALNQSGDFYVTHTRINGVYCIRVVIGQTYVGQTHLNKLIEILNRLIGEIC